VTKIYIFSFLKFLLLQRPGIESLLGIFPRLLVDGDQRVARLYGAFRVNLPLSCVGFVFGFRPYPPCKT
jgi:hypothetical protein